MRQLGKFLARPFATLALQPSTRTSVALRDTIGQTPYRQFSWKSGCRYSGIQRESDARWWGGESGDLATVTALVQHATKNVGLTGKARASPGPSDKVRTAEDPASGFQISLTVLVSQELACM